MQRVIEAELGFIATICPDGTPNLSPKGTAAVWDDGHLVFAGLRSPGNGREPAVECGDRNRLRQLSPACQSGCAPAPRSRPMASPARWAVHAGEVIRTEGTGTEPSGVIRAGIGPTMMRPFLRGQGSPVRSGWRWARLRGWPADHFDEAEDDQQQDGDQHHDRSGRLAPEDEDQRGQRDRPDA